ncbi:glycosyltransferase family 39 protein [Aquihabitans sp. G128]|uniref:glycosyltransferase family 39 protein n=1 Tax=Aquihabitans sp. G128 TaxID=2849779 RepID=UPI001C24EDF1|nr:glycosyltransferase family 39 protein [Aquihabitans sp. G128]QXC59483.1 glycosyltransferase family 39 protein [Aquihabitans sp. G128]
MDQSWLRKTRRWAPVFAAAAAVRVAYWVVVIPTWVPNADADQYVQLGRGLADGKGFSLVFPQMELHATAFRPPLYPALLAPTNLVFGNALWPARLLSVLLGSLVVVLAGVLAARIGGRTAGYAAAAAVALYPPLLANDTVTLTEPLALALLLGLVLLADAERWVPAGLLTGLFLLTRPNGYLVVLVVAFWAWRKVGTRAALGAVAATLVVFVPWLVRNQVQVGTFRPTTSDGFTMAAIYAQPAQDAGTFIDPVFSHAYDDPDHRLAQFDEVVWNDRLTKDALHGVKAHPDYVWRTVRRNFRGYFEISAELNTYPEVNDGRDMALRDHVRPIFFAVTILGLVGLARSWRDRRVIALSVLVASFVVLSLLLVAPPRLRAPFDLACCIGLGLLVAAFLPDRWRLPELAPDATVDDPPVDEPAAGQPAPA